MRSKAVIACSAVLAVILVMAIISFAAQGAASPVSDFFGIVTKPFRAAASSISGAIGRFYSRMYEYDELLEENERLKKTIADMEEDIRIGEQLIAENERPSPAATSRSAWQTSSAAAAPTGSLRSPFRRDAPAA